MEELESKFLTIQEWNKFILDASVVDIMKIWQEIPEEQLAQYFISLNHEQQVDLLVIMSTSEQEELILSLANKDIEELLNDIPPDDLVDLFQKIGPEVRDTVWQNLSEETKKITNFLLRFDYDDAAGIMTPNYVKVKPNITVEKTIAFIRSNVDEMETIYYIYVVDAINRLQGVVSLRDIFREKDKVRLSEFMVTKIISVQDDTDQEEVAETLKSHDLLAVPVLDKYNRLLGIVTIDDAIQVMKDEHDEDILKMGGISAGSKSHPQSYLERSVFSLFKSRIPWLIILLVAGTLTTNVINGFTNLIYLASYLVLFIPVITGMGGNTATQSATLMIQGLSRNDLAFKNTFRIFFKETIVALLIGVSLALVMMVRSLLFPPTLPILDAVVVSTSLIFVVLFSAIFGVLAPLIISKLGADPTVIAAPLMATLIDLVGLSIYFLMAQMFIK